MKKYTLIMIFMIISLFGYSQQNECPKIVIDSLGNKFVMMTIEQAQKVDNNFELVSLLEKGGSQCDSLNKSYLVVIDKQGNEIHLLELDIDEMRIRINDKNLQIVDLQNQLSNEVKNTALCDDQKVNDEKSISILKREVRRQKLQKFGAVIVGGAFIVVETLMIIGVL